MTTLIIHPQSEEHENLFELLAKALKVPFEKLEDNSYNLEFAEKIQQGIEDERKGLGRKVTLEELDTISKNFSEKYAGKLPSDVADELREYVSNSRNEWDSNRI